MNGAITENQLIIVKEYKSDNPLITEIDSILDKCFEGCHNNKYFHKFKSDIKLTNVTNNETFRLTIKVRI